MTIITLPCNGGLRCRLSICLTYTVQGPCSSGFLYQFSPDIGSLWHISRLLFPSSLLYFWYEFRVAGFEDLGIPYGSIVREPLNFTKGLFFNFSYLFVIFVPRSPEFWILNPKFLYNIEYTINQIFSQSDFYYNHFYCLFLYFMCYNICKGNRIRKMRLPQWLN